MKALTRILKVSLAIYLIQLLIVIFWTTFPIAKETHEGKQYIVKYGNSQYVDLVPFIGTLTCLTTLCTGENVKLFIINLDSSEEIYKEYDLVDDVFREYPNVFLSRT